MHRVDIEFEPRTLKKRQFVQWCAESVIVAFTTCATYSTHQIIIVTNNHYTDVQDNDVDNDVLTAFPSLFNVLKSYINSIVKGFRESLVKLIHYLSASSSLCLPSTPTLIYLFIYPKSTRSCVPRNVVQCLLKKNEAKICENTIWNFNYELSIIMIYLLNKEVLNTCLPVCY